MGVGAVRMRDALRVWNVMEMWDTAESCVM